MERIAEILREHPNDLPPVMKAFMLLGQHMAVTHNGAYYGRAQNLVPAVTLSYDRALEKVDVLVLPTTPYTALPALPESPATVDQLRFGVGINVNAAPMNVTGHPALTLPCGRVDGLPVGLMVVGRRGEDITVLRVGRILEALCGFSA
jgi:amidase